MEARKVKSNWKYISGKNRAQNSNEKTIYHLQSNDYNKCKTINQENEKSNKKVRIKHKWKCSNILLFQFFY